MAEEFVFHILVLLLSAIALGEVFKRIKIPAMVGHLLAGVIVGPSLLNLVHTDESFLVFIDLCVFFLMFIAGLELHPEKVKKAGKKAIMLSILAFVIPFLSVFQVMQLLEQSLLSSLFVSLALAITAVPVSAIVLMEFGLFKSKLGSTVITAGVINEILALIVLAVILQMSAGDSNTVDPVEVTFATGKIVTFLGGVFLVDYVLGKVKHHIPTKIIPVFEKLKTRESEFAIMLIVALTMSLIAELAGLHFIIGTFFAGLIIYRKLIGKKNFEIASEVSSKITFGFFSPIFFAFIGTELYAKDLVDVLPMFFVLLIVAIGGKIGGGFIASKISGFSTIESKTIGYLMNSRGMVELVIAVVGLETGLIDNSMFAIVVTIGFITTLLAPIMSRVSLKKLKKQISEEK